MSVQYGKRVPVVLADHLAQTQPHTVYASYPESDDLRKGFRDVTWKEFANAVNRAAFWLEKTLGGKSSTFETIGYIGVADLRYFIFTLAANKTGYKLLVPSPRNALLGQLNLIDKTECHRFVLSEDVSIQDVLKERPDLSCYPAAALDYFLDPTTVPAYPYTKTYEEAKRDPYIVFHSSGSTGLPKPIVITQGATCTMDALNLVEPLNGRELFYRFFAKLCPRFFCSLPFFHSAGAIVGLLHSMFFGNIAVFGPPGRPLTPDLMDDMIDYGHIDGTFSPPSILDEMSKTEGSLERLSKLKMIFSGSGPLSSHAGYVISQKTFLAIVIGSTEAMAMVLHAPDPEDWEYFMINEDVAGIEMRHDSEHDLYKMVYVRRPELELLQGIFQNFPDRHEYDTGDLFEKHPTKPHLWHSVGRADDLLVLSNGEKVQPGPIADVLSSHKAVREALVVGHSRFQLAAILELRQYPKSEEESQKLMDDIWPTVEKANEQAPAHGRLVRQFVTFASPDKPFARVAKGSISKPATVKLYSSEIDTLYEQGESEVALEIGPLDTSSDETLRSSVRSACEKVLGRPIPTPDTDIFSAGADSLTALTLAATLRKKLQAATTAEAEKINTRFIYSYSSVNKLTAALMALVNGTDSTAKEDEGAVKSIKNLVNLVTSTMDLGPASDPIPSAKPASSVLLTGSTGSLGSYMLDLLISDPSITKVYCFNRAVDGTARQTESNISRGLTTDFHKVVFLMGDVSKAGLGLGAGAYEVLTREVKYIIHSQWPVNFNMSLSSFEPYVRGVANLASLASRTTSRAPICFLSSVAAVQSWSVQHGATKKVPESSLSDATLAPSGYGLSKLAGSLVLEKAAKHGISSITLRLGQIAGPAERGLKGAWQKAEWVPSMVASSKALGALPDSLGAAERIEWLPVDRVARIICEIAAGLAPGTSSGPAAAGYGNVVSPEATVWQAAILPAVQRYFGGKLETVSLSEWVTRLRQSAVGATPEQTLQNPAIKLLDFFGGLVAGPSMPRLETQHTMAASPTLKQCQAVNEKNMMHWLATWAF